MSFSMTPYPLLSTGLTQEIYAEAKIREPLYFILKYYIKHLTEMQPKTILDVTFTFSNTCTTPVMHT